jgi:lysozyme family protein
MNNNFTQSLTSLLEDEGGFVNNPADPGGMTNLGVTKAAWEQYVGRPVSEKDMRALTPTMVTPFYKQKYWDRVRGDELQDGLDYCVFDVAVNSGPGRAIKFLQTECGVPADGGFGPTTFAAVSQFTGDPLKTFITGYCQERLKFMQSLPAWSTFGKGWGNRVAKVEKRALEMVK